MISTLFLMTYLGSSFVFSQDKDYKLVASLCSKCSSGDERACKKLEDIVLNNKHDGVRFRASECVTNQEVLTKVALYDNNRHARDRAVKKITDQNILKTVLLKDKDSMVRQSAANKLDDKEFLHSLAFNDNDLSVREIAIKKIATPEILKDLYKNGNGNDRTLIIELIEDQPFLEGIAKDTELYGVHRSSAISKLKDQILLTELATTDKEKHIRRVATSAITDLKTVAKIALTDKEDFVKLTAVERLEDQNILYKIAINDGYSNVRNAAIKRISNESQLFTVALNDKAFLNRIEAIKKISDQKMLAEIARKDKEWGVKNEAVVKITDNIILQDFAIDRPDLLFLKYRDQIINKNAKCPSNANNVITWKPDGEISVAAGAKFIIEANKIHYGDWCDGTKHIWQGKHNDIRGIFKEIVSDSLNPLVFYVDNSYGYEYVSGNGSISIKDIGTVIYPINSAKTWEGKADWNGLQAIIKFTTDQSVRIATNIKLTVNCKKGDGEIAGFNRSTIDIVDNIFKFELGVNNIGNAVYNPVTRKFTGKFSAPLKLHCGTDIFEINGDWEAFLKNSKQ